MRRWRDWLTKRRLVAGSVALAVAAGAAVAALDRSANPASPVVHPRMAAPSFTADETDTAGQARAAMSGAGGGAALTAGEAAATGQPVPPIPASTPPPAVGTDRVVRTASLELEVRRGAFGEAFRAASEVASAHGGFVAGSTSSTGGSDDQPASGALTLRVPGDRFDAARRALSALGKVKSEQLAGTDVGGQLVDLGARLASARVQEDALRTLMGRATTVGETLQVQEQLGRVRQEIEQLTAEQARLQDQVAMASIEVRLAEPGAVSTRPEEPSGLGRSLERAVDGAVAVVGGTIVVIGYLVPLVLLGLLAWLVVRVAGSFSRRRATVPTTSG